MSIHRHSPRRIFALFVLGAGILASPAARAVVINFESSSGYATGNLIGQTQTGTGHAWRGASGDNASVLRVTSDGNGGQYLKSYNVVTAVGGPNFIFDTTSADLGGTVSAPFNNQSSRVAFDFSFRYDDTLAASSSAGVRFYVGSTSAPAMTLEFLTNGQINYNNGTTNYKVQTAGATTFTATTGTWINVSGLVDYSTQRYSIFFNGVEQIGGSSIGGGLSFRNVNATGQSAVLLLRDLASGTSNFVGYSLDNITLAMVPEPSSYAFCSGALALSFVGLRRRRRRIDA